MPPPPDAGLAPERTALSWARTWAVLGAVVLLLVRASLELSPWVAGSLAAAGLVPLAGLSLTRLRHARRVGRFVADGPRVDARPNLLLVVATVALAVVGMLVLVARLTVAG